RLLGSWRFKTPPAFLYSFQADSRNTMKKLCTWIIAFLLVLAAVPQLNAETKHAKTAAVIVALENKWADAQKAGDANAVAPLLHENFITTDVSGHSYNKKELLAT